MSLNERLRAELRSIETGELREDDALDSVLRNHDRGLVRRRVIRQALAVAVVVSLFASVAMVVAWRNSPDHTGAGSAADRWRSTATIHVATASGAKELAMTPSTQRVALEAAHLSPDAPNTDFRATLNSSRDVLSLTVTAPTSFESEAVDHAWTSAFMSARRDEAIERLRGLSHALSLEVAGLHKRLSAAEVQLARIDPIAYAKPPLHYGVPNSHPLSDELPTPRLRKHAGAQERNLWNERVRLLARLANLGAEAARNRISNPTPGIAATLISQAPAIRVPTSSPSRTEPILVGWAIGLAVVLTAAVLAYRRRFDVNSRRYP